VWGSGFRANATAGRAIRLGAINGLGLQPHAFDQATQGNPGKYSCFIAADGEYHPCPISVNSDKSVPSHIGAQSLGAQSLGAQSLGAQSSEARKPVRAVAYVDQETGTAVGEVPDPSPGPDDVIVAVEACGLCGSDVHSVHIAGACAFSDETYRESVAHLAAGRVPVERLVSERVSLDGTPDALRRLQAPGSLVRILSRPWD
jgi:hypothetical protein